MMKWKPLEVTVADIAFGPPNIEQMLPPYNEIPDKFKQMYEPWNKFWSKIFFEGGDASWIEAVDGIDREQALQHLQAVLGSFAPSHERKIAGIAYLSSLWFKKSPPL